MRILIKNFESCVNRKSLTFLKLLNFPKCKGFSKNKVTSPFRDMYVYTFVIFIFFKTPRTMRNLNLKKELGEEN